MAVTEFQKHGLPHGHVLIMVDPSDRPRNPEAVDTVESAELPDENQKPKLYRSVVKHMLHGPCNKNCLDNNGK
jgi:hypothetical protein